MLVSRKRLQMHPTTTQTHTHTHTDRIIALSKDSSKGSHRAGDAIMRALLQWWQALVALCGDGLGWAQCAVG